MFSSSIVLASGVSSNSNASRDIINNDALWGVSLDKLDKVAGLISTGFGAVVSLLGVFIIGSALLRNVCAGTVAAYPKFWAKVHAAHKQIRANSNIASDIAATARGQNSYKLYGTYKSKVDEDNEEIASTLALVFLRLLPDLVSASDFDNMKVKPRTYFIKAIPQMCGIIIIGVFIWNGYYRDAASLVGNTGAIIAERLLLNTDPSALLDKAFGMVTQPDFGPTFGAGGINSIRPELTREIFSTVRGRHSDINSRASQESLATNIGNIVDTLIDLTTDMTFTNPNPVEVTQFSGEELFDTRLFSRQYHIALSINTTGFSSPYVSDFNESRHVIHSSSSYGFIVVWNIHDIRNTFNFSSNIDLDVSYNLTITLQFTKLSDLGQSSSSTTVSNAVLEITAGRIPAEGLRLSLNPNWSIPNVESRGLTGFSLNIEQPNTIILKPSSNTQIGGNEFASSLLQLNQSKSFRYTNPEDGTVHTVNVSSVKLINDSSNNGSARILSQTGQELFKD